MRCTVWCTILGVQYYYDTYITYLLCGLPYVLFYMVYGIQFMVLYTIFCLWYRMWYYVTVYSILFYMVYGIIFMVSRIVCHAHWGQGVTMHIGGKE